MKRHRRFAKRPTLAQMRAERVAWRNEAHAAIVEEYLADPTVSISDMNHKYHADSKRVLAQAGIIVAPRQRRGAARDAVIEAVLKTFYENPKMTPNQIAAIHHVPAPAILAARGLIVKESKKKMARWVRVQVPKTKNQE